MRWTVSVFPSPKQFQLNVTKVDGEVPRENPTEDVYLHPHLYCLMALQLTFRFAFVVTVLTTLVL